MADRSLYLKHFGGNINNQNLICSTPYTFDEDTFEFKGYKQKYDNGKEADENGHYTFESIKNYIESKGKTELVKGHL